MINSTCKFFNKSDRQWTYDNVTYDSLRSTMKISDYLDRIEELVYELKNRVAISKPPSKKCYKCFQFKSTLSFSKTQLCKQNGSCIICNRKI